MLTQPLLQYCEQTSNVTCQLAAFLFIPIIGLLYLYNNKIHEFSFNVDFSAVLLQTNRDHHDDAHYGHDNEWKTPRSGGPYEPVDKRTGNNRANSQSEFPEHVRSRAFMYWKPVFHP